MARVSVLIAFLTHFLCALGQKQLSQCSEYFTYMTKPGTNDILGQIEIPPPSANDIFYLKVALNATTELSQVVRLELARSIKESVERVHRGKPLLYHIYCPMNEQIVSLSAIWFNSQRYCPNSEVSGNITANVELGHILSPPNEEPIVYCYGPWEETSKTWHRNISIYRIDDPPYDRLNLNDSTPMTVSSSDENANECGITSYYNDDTNRLTPDGEKTSPGQWPWLVAIYRLHLDNSIGYGCTGSILTTRHIITTGVCVIASRDDLNKVVIVNPEQLIVRFGQFKSLQWNGNLTGIIHRVPVDIKTSFIYLQTLDNVAILIFRTGVIYNAFIKPICLWSGSTNLQDTVNMTGYLTGWGFSIIWSEGKYQGTSDYIEEPRMAKVSLWNLSVDPLSEYGLQYRLVYPEFSCPAELGTGLVVFNTTMGRYQLRGVTNYCTEGLIRFFDIAKRTSWIRQQILLT